MEEKKEFIISLLILTFVILATLSILFSAFLRTCEEDYNPCNECREHGYLCTNPSYKSQGFNEELSNMSFNYSNVTEEISK